MSTTYETRTDAIAREIIEPLAGHVASIDVEAIANRIVERTERGYVCTVEPDEFWQLVGEHDLSVHGDGAAEFDRARANRPAWAQQTSMHNAEARPVTWHSRTADAVPVDHAGKPHRITLEQVVSEGMINDPLVYVEVAALSIEQARVLVRALSDLVEAFDAAQ